MSTKKGIEDVKRGANSPKRDSAPDDFPPELGGEFVELPEQLIRNIGTVAGLSVSGGGYFGLSITDDGGSCRLAVRNGTFVLDKRFSAITKLEGALAYVLRKLE